MSEWTAKRFWTEVSLRDEPAGFGISLDSRPIKTPAKQPLIAPTRAFAEAIAAEWESQSDKIDPASMPFTRSANAALDKVVRQHREVADMLAAYGDSDLLCYRADRPQSLVDRQAAQWNPFLEWGAEVLEARLEPRTGVMHVPQAEPALATLRARVHAMSPFELAGFHDLVSLSGSLILGFAATFDLRTPKAIWDISRLDEIWQAEEWGADEDAEAAALVKEHAFIHAKQVFDLSRNSEMPLV
ncbi:ATP12 family chaperone protein [Roseobacter weihaiensis]|uniref:ATP12 family chaperone protein n=1 Tax=Roseobacter weihaiensis TaxID=2763262 RepID=UPI001D0BAC6E|nr:ATP12 family protein [Roseobacter sp. H9]